MSLVLILSLSKVTAGQLIALPNRNDNLFPNLKKKKNRLLRGNKSIRLIFRLVFEYTFPSSLIS